MSRRFTNSVVMRLLQCSRQQEGWRGMGRADLLQVYSWRALVVDAFTCMTCEDEHSEDSLLVEDSKSKASSMGLK